MTVEKKYRQPETKAIEQDKIEDTNLVLCDGDAAFYTRIVFCDERPRYGRIPMFTVASVTLDSKDESWGEFMSTTQLRELHEWTGDLLKRIEQEGK